MSSGTSTKLNGNLVQTANRRILGRTRASSTSSTRSVPKHTPSSPRAGAGVKLSTILPIKSSGYVTESPLVELHAEPWITRFGWKSKSFFKVIGWRGGDSQVIDGHGGGPRDGGPTPALVEASSIPSRTIDDEIPF